MMATFCICGAVGCGGSGEGNPQDQDLSVKSARNSDRSINYELSALMAALPSTHGNFPSETGSAFSGDAWILEAFRTHGDSAVAALVECINDATPVAATWMGRPLLLGHLCGEALRRTAYHEHADELGDLTADWPGYAYFDATLDQLNGAKAAWKEVVENRRYVLLR